jgi:hypothetical protein
MLAVLSDMGLSLNIIATGDQSPAKNLREYRVCNSIQASASDNVWWSTEYGWVVVRICSSVLRPPS